MKNPVASSLQDDGPVMSQYGPDLEKKVVGELPPMRQGQEGYTSSTEILFHTMVQLKQFDTH
jgi:hypothetical protein